MSGLCAGKMRLSNGLHAQKTFLSLLLKSGGHLRYCDFCEACLAAIAPSLDQSAGTDDYDCPQ
jgi:hypothetical protein